jgi:Ribosomal protein S5
VRSPAAIAKGQLDAKKHMYNVPRIKGTVHHPDNGHDVSGTSAPASGAPGTRGIAGGSGQAGMECPGSPKY